MEIISRTWAMPNKSTFKIKPIKDLLERYVPIPGHNWADPFSGNSTRCEFSNDINPQLNPVGLDARSYLSNLKSSLKNRKLSGLLLDPPYSLNQLRTLYNEFENSRGLYCVRPDSMIYWSKFKNEIADIIAIDGYCISFGWNSMGLGINRGFEKVEILLVAHGGSRNDTIVVVEKKVRKRTTK